MQNWVYIRKLCLTKKKPQMFENAHRDILVRWGNCVKMHPIREYVCQHTHTFLSEKENFLPQADQNGRRMRMVFSEMQLTDCRNPTRESNSRHFGKRYCTFLTWSQYMVLLCIVKQLPTYAGPNRGFEDHKTFQEQCNIALQQVPAANEGALSLSLTLFTTSNWLSHEREV